LDLSPAGLWAETKNANLIDTFEIQIPKLPPSVNSMYSTGKTGRRFLTKPGKDFKRFVRDVNAIYLRGKKLDPTHWYEVFITFYLPLLTKQERKVKVWDVTNHVKALEDALAESLGLDDSRFLAVRAAKLPITHKQEPMTHVRIVPINIKDLLGETA
jgi:Holliday junction resolvase RusA-like endonuclease